MPTLRGSRLINAHGELLPNYTFQIRAISSTGEVIKSPVTEATTDEIANVAFFVPAGRYELCFGRDRFRINVPSERASGLNEIFLSALIEHK